MLEIKKLKSVIVALDNLDQDSVLKLIPFLNQHYSCVKIGLELYLRYGVELLQKIQAQSNLDIFLDLKLHDIPKTVSLAIKSLGQVHKPDKLKGLETRLKFLTIHLSGGQSMLDAALESQLKYLPHCQLLGVTILTSLDENQRKVIYAGADMKESVSTMIDWANRSGLNHFVCSANDLSHFKSDILQKNTFITPGIRFQDDHHHGDQKRVLDPVQAINAGSSYLVMGRSLLSNLEHNTKVLHRLFD